MESERRIPVLLHVFGTAVEARKALDLGIDGVSLTLPSSAVPLSVGEQVLVLFRVGDGDLCQAEGQVQLSENFVSVGFEGMNARVVKREIDRGTGALRNRRYARQGCLMRVALEIYGHGARVNGVASDVGLGGARIASLSRRLPPGTLVTLRFDDLPQTISARIAWSNLVASGVEFFNDRENLVPVRRVLSLARRSSPIALGGLRH